MFVMHKVNLRIPVAAKRENQKSLSVCVASNFNDSRAARLKERCLWPCFRGESAKRLTQRQPKPSYRYTPSKSSCADTRKSNHPTIVWRNLRLTSGVCTRRAKSATSYFFTMKERFSRLCSKPQPTGGRCFCNRSSSRTLGESVAHKKENSECTSRGSEAILAGAEANPGLAFHWRTLMLTPKRTNG